MNKSINICMPSEPFTDEQVKSIMKGIRDRTKEVKRPPTVEYINDEYTDTEKTTIYYNIGIGWCLGCLTFTFLMVLFHTC